MLFNIPNIVHILYNKKVITIIFCYFQITNFRQQEINIWDLNITKC